MNGIDIDKEKSFLEDVYSTYTVDDSLQTEAMRKLIYRTFEPYVTEGCYGLELGCSDGLMTEMLASKVEKLDVVDGSKQFLEKAGVRKLKNVEYFYSLFEEFDTQPKYDFVIASYILEHVLDPVQVMNMAYSVLKPGGLLFIVVPNARALSRQLAVHMDLLPDVKSLTENDYNHGHRRVYDRQGLNADIRSTGFSVVSEGGVMLKILADFQMDELIGQGLLGDSQLDGLYRLGMEYPDLCGSIFSVCKR